MQLKHIFLTSSFVFALVLLAQAQIAVKGEMVYTMDRDPIENGVVLIKDGKITAVGASSAITIPVGYTVHEGKVVTPGLVDAHSMVGVSGMYNQPWDQDQLETSAAIQPELQAVDAYNPIEPLIGFLMSRGVTTIHTGHGIGALVSGQTMIVKTRGNSVEEAIIEPATMLAMTLGQTVTSNYKKPGTRSKGMAMIRGQLIKAQEYQAKKKKEPSTSTDLGMEALSKLLSGEYKALITVHRSSDIMSALRLADEFGFKLVLDGAAESYMMIEEIKASGAEIILHPTNMRIYGSGPEYANGSMETAGKLHEAGIPVVIQSGFEQYVPKTRVVLYEAALAAANGLPFNEALRAITINAAKVLEIDDRVGSLTVGKDADVVIYDGDPFEYVTHVCTVIIDGEVTHSECK
ncbi:MAG: amidohydrolase family protein [Cyclobacteriaceae bacterium]